MRTLRSVLRPLSLCVCWIKSVNRDQGAVAILMYHRVTGDMELETDVPFEHFQAQMALLGQTGRVISLDAALAGLQRGWPDGELRYVLTFDDAYEDFYTHALPVLEAQGLPATLYVPTAFITGDDCTIVREEMRGDPRLKPTTWAMLRELASNSLITIGAHTHTHPEMPALSDPAIVDELATCDRLLERELDLRPKHFAYPRGIWNNRVRDLVTSRYESAVRVDGGLAYSGIAEAQSLPRIPIQRSDGMRWFKRRIAGELRFEESVIAGLKRIVYKLRGY